MKCYDVSLQTAQPKAREARLTYNLQRTTDNSLVVSYQLFVVC